MRDYRKPRRRGDTYGAGVEGSTQRLHLTTEDRIAARLGFPGTPLYVTILAVLGAPIAIGVFYGLCWVAYAVGKAVGTI